MGGKKTHGAMQLQQCDGETASGDDVPVRNVQV